MYIIIIFSYFSGYTTDNTTYYETLTYANGPGYNYHRQNDTQSNKTWISVENDQNRDLPYYQHLAAFYLKDETHGGEDVPVYATGNMLITIRFVQFVELTNLL